MLNQALIYWCLLVTVAATAPSESSSNGSRSLFSTQAPGPENKCCYQELNKFVENGLDSPKIFQVLVHPKHATCPPHGPEHPKHNWNLANLTKCLSTCKDMYNSGDEFVYANNLVNALKFTMIMCQRKFEKVEKFLHDISDGTEDKCQKKTEALMSSIHNVYMTWENFEDTCKTRIDAVKCFNESLKNDSIVQDVEHYLHGLLATVYYIMKAQEAANDQPRNHSIPSGAEVCKTAINDTLHYLENIATVPSVSLATDTMIVEPDHNQTQDNESTTKGDSSDATTQKTDELSPSSPSGSPSLPPGNDTTVTNASSTVAFPNGPAQSTALLPNATENSGNSNKCYGFNHLTIVMVLTVVLGVTLPAAMDFYQS
ncbi:hypothetical protein Ddc_09905 [Ditylenchus destructor]|nr:hypothetical protein Ddc_09905 [Ditylenchus destructor]